MRGVQLGTTGLRIVEVAPREDRDASESGPCRDVAELRDDNKDLIGRLRAAHEVCSEHNDTASTSLIEQWIDEAERRHWFLFETSRRADAAGH